MRRASGFNQLYEYLINKEQDPNVAAAAVTAPDTRPHPIGSIQPPPPFGSDDETLPTSRTKRGRKVAARRDIVKSVRHRAIADIKQLQNQPSLKWTWGVDMAKGELANLKRAADGGNKLPHSGYDSSLSWGRDSRSNSIPPSPIHSDGYFSDLGDDVRPVEDMDERLCLPFFWSHLRRESLSPLPPIPCHIPPPPPKKSMPAGRHSPPGSPLPSPPLDAAMNSDEGNYSSLFKLLIS